MNIYHVTYAFQSESTPYSSLNIKELLPWNRHEFWNLSDCNGTIQCGFTMKRVRDMIRIYSPMYHTDKYSKHSSIIWPVWLNGWVFVYKLSGYGFESCCSYLNYRICTCFEQGVLWHSGNFRMWIHSETRMWHDKNMQLKITVAEKN